MKERELEKMQLNDLWDLHQRIIAVLDRRLEDEKQRLQRQLDELGRKFGGSPKDIPQRRPYWNRNIATREILSRLGRGVDGRPAGPLNC
jgi:hypothetical protein